MVGAIGTRRKLVPFLHDVLKAAHHLRLREILADLSPFYEKASLDHRSKICTDADDAE